MRAMMSMVLVVAMAGTALAQAPGQSLDPQPPAAPPAQPYAPPSPQPYPQPPPASQQPLGPQYGYGQRPVMQYQLTLDEQDLLERGYISDGQHIGGGIASLMFGMGIGQAIQGRWTDTGWIFTFGEITSTTFFVWGFVDLFSNFACVDCPASNDDRAVAMMFGGAIGMVVFRTWGVIDAFVGPSSHNRKLRALHMRLGMPVPMYSRVAPYVNRAHDGGAVAGLSLRF